VFIVHSSPPEGLLALFLYLRRSARAKQSHRKRRALSSLNTLAAPTYSQCSRLSAPAYVHCSPSCILRTRWTRPCTTRPPPPGVPPLRAVHAVAGEDPRLHGRRTAGCTSRSAGCGIGATACRAACAGSRHFGLERNTCSKLEPLRDEVKRKKEKEKKLSKIETLSV